MAAATDARLRRAWYRYQVVIRRHREQLATVTGRELTPVDQELLRLEDRLAALPAVDLGGAIIKLRYLFYVLDGPPEAEAAVIDGAPLPADSLSDYRLRALWSVIGDLDALRAVRHPRGPQTRSHRPSH